MCHPYVKHISIVYCEATLPPVTGQKYMFEKRSKKPKTAVKLGREEENSNIQNASQEFPKSHNFLFIFYSTPCIFSGYGIVSKGLGYS